jgi:hypothetical protein
LADKNAAIAEAKFMRAVAYYHLAVYWGAVPIIEDNSKLIENPLLPRNIVSDVYKFAANDLTYAAQYLPNTDEKGRVTTWSAQGMLGKVYLTMAGVGKSGGSRDQALLDSAKKYAGNVCKNSGLTLLPNYADLFKAQNNDNQESLFALQWAAGVPMEPATIYKPILRQPARCFLQRTRRMAVISAKLRSIPNVFG